MPVEDDLGGEIDQREKAKKMGRGGREDIIPYGEKYENSGRGAQGLDKRGDETESLGKSGESLDWVMLDYAKL